MNKDESLKDAALRELQEETSVTEVHLEQFGAFGDPDRDPRGWIVSVGYVGLVPTSQIYVKAADDAEAAEWFPIDELPELAFDHKMIIGKAMEHVKDLCPLLYVMFKHEK